MAPKELGSKSLKINKLPAKMGSKELASSQMPLDLGIEREIEVDGIGMGVLSDGTPFLTGRGLARLVGMENLHIRTIGIEWNETPSKPRIEGIKKILGGRGLDLARPYIAIRRGDQTLHAFPDAVCLAVLEFYAFDAAQTREVARKNFRVLAGKALRDFIYTQVGYDPSNVIPIAWRQFHDRVTLNYASIPHGYFSVFKEIADIIVTLIRGGASVGAQFIPDISVGQHWATHWRENDLKAEFGDRREYRHQYPDYFPQSASNPQPAYCYPDAALPEFRRWVRAVYLADKFPSYLKNKERQGILPPSFTQLAIAAVAADREAS